MAMMDSPKASHDIRFARFAIVLAVDCTLIVSEWRSCSIVSAFVFSRSANSLAAAAFFD